LDVYLSSIFEFVRLGKTNASFEIFSLAGTMALTTQLRPGDLRAVT
jgi:hypothetical protein